MNQQRTDKWMESRRGLFTASEIYKLMGAKGLGQTGETYIHQKVAEFFGVYKEDVFSSAIAWGNEYEPMAKDYYSIAFSEVLKDEGFLISDCGNHGASPDALIVGKEKGIEIKCPYDPTNHIKNMLIKSADDLKKLHPEYYWQIQHNILVTGYKSWDFVSFDPRFTGSKRMFAIEIKRNEEDIKLLIERINQAVEIRDSIIRRIEL